MAQTITDELYHPTFSDIPFEDEGLQASDTYEPLEFPPLGLKPSNLNGTPFSQHGTVPVDLALASPGTDGGVHFDPLGPATPGECSWRQEHQPGMFAQAMLPFLNTEFPTNFDIMHGQLTPPSPTHPSRPFDSVAAINPAEIALKDDMATQNNLTSCKDPLPTDANTSTFNPSSSTDKPTPPTNPPAQPKSKRGRKKKILGPAAREAQHNRTLARNRVAAQRCRQRKKVEYTALEEQARGLGRKRVALQGRVNGLREELLWLKGKMLQHAACIDSDGKIAEYVQRQRDALWWRELPEGEHAAVVEKDDDIMDVETFLRVLGVASDMKQECGHGEDHEGENSSGVEEYAASEFEEDKSAASGSADRLMPGHSPPPALQDNSDAGIASRLRTRPPRTRAKAGAV